MEAKCLLICTLLLTLVSLATAARWACPAQDIPGNPCYCVNQNDFFLQDWSIRCQGNTTTQQHIDDYVTLMRTLNDFLTVTPTPDFWFDNTNLTSLNLEVFRNSKFWYWHVHGNLQLNQIIAPADLNLAFRDGSFFNFTPAVFSDLLQIEKLQQSLDNELLWQNSNVGAYFGTPLLASIFERLPNVGRIQMHYNNIEHLVAGDFSGLKSLWDLGIGYNGMKSVGVNGLILPDTSAPYLTVSFQGAELSEEVMSPLTGITTANATAPVLLDFTFNEFEFISAETFEGFLNAHPGNGLVFYFNDFVCDSRMKWLKDGRDKYESRVTELECVNDPGKNIWTTDLV